MNKFNKTIFIGIFSINILFGLPSQSYANANTKKTTIDPSAEIKKLQNLWMNYQDNLLLMDKALITIKNETDDNKRNALIAQHTKKLTQTTNALNRLVLTNNSANKLRQQITEHANKYQNVYQLAALTKPTEQQRNMFTRLNQQTTQLFTQMKTTASTL